MHMVSRLILRVMTQNQLLSTEDNEGVSKRLELWNAVEFWNGEFGKPQFSQKFLDEWGTLHFNISHDWPWVLVGVDQKNELGVDITHVSVPRNTHLLTFLNELGSQFSLAEVSCITDLVNMGLYKQAEEILFTCWAVKEAISKQTGIGLGMDYKSISYNPNAIKNNVFKVVLFIV
ncbi:L-aminoadipate-semialdehyde dehydrogenase-phosphopantetheinyl transferase [Zancudomyces culisetae]|uniref:holo-[acyl-carrier-protein] synthase n=1 Tax=Zancudomyces culisetae TaxID=1213189 RepID=A0A1R1PS80_ZANCU|nr:L-aminoadipate-semialdehyde dehydrogenase-phosphopantetheinyl transferase [Zancudomyces culisetae]|eukprot:OMH83779.1 L-aminoadipate-semialdehyde dehydrogenase-phosphopantetheinyl transferase [Zancudomyces culisetae]